MAALPLPPPEIQFLDGNGHPYAGGTLETYVPGTTSPKDTWQDEGETVLNTNPIVLDAAGRALVWGQGDYRFILRDSTGQLVYDAVSAVVDTSTFATTADISAAVQAETNRATAAESNLQSQISAEVSRATGAENTLTTNLNNEISRATAEENNLQSQITALSGSSSGVLTVRAGYGVTDASGSFTATFSPPFSTTAVSFVACSMGPNWLQEVSVNSSVTTSGGTVYSYQDAGGGIPVSGVPCYWIAVGY